MANSFLKTLQCFVVSALNVALLPKNANNTTAQKKSIIIIYYTISSQLPSFVDSITADTLHNVLVIYDLSHFRLVSATSCCFFVPCLELENGGINDISLTETIQ